MVQFWTDVAGMRLPFMFVWSSSGRIKTLFDVKLIVMSEAKKLVSSLPGFCSFSGLLCQTGYCIKIQSHKNEATFEFIAAEYCTMWGTL